MFAGVLLPVAFAAHARSGFDFEDSGNPAGQAGKTARPKIRRNGHQMCVPQQRHGDEIILRSASIRCRRLAPRFALGPKQFHSIGLPIQRRCHSRSIVGIPIGFRNVLRPQPCFSELYPRQGT
jgi:hypothetical protein